MKRKLLSLVIALCMIISLLPLITGQAEATWIDGGYSTAWFEGEGPYNITSAAELAGLSALVDAGESFKGCEFVLTDDIDLSGRDWVPIGTGYNAFKRFCGSFDGGGFTISGMRITGSFNAVGLFGYVRDGHIANLTLDESCSIRGSGTNVGSIAGASFSTIDNCVNYAAISSPYDGTNANVGGIVGYLGSSGAMINCINEGNVSATGRSRKNLGGLVGLAQGSIMRSVNLGTVSSSCSGAVNNAGGLIGFDDGATTQNCYNRADVTANGGRQNYAGGLIGRLSSNYGKLINCYNTARVTARDGDASIGGVVGKRISGTVFYCYYKKYGDMTGIGAEDDMLGFATQMTAAQMKAIPGDAYGAWSTVSVDGYNIGGASLVDAMNRGIIEVPEIWSFDELENDSYPIIAINNWTDNARGVYYFADFSWISGSGSEANPYIISDGADLAGLSAIVNARPGQVLRGIALGGEGNYSTAVAQSFKDKYIMLANDIELDKRLWTPIGDDEHPFEGSFDGNGYKIRNMNIGTERINADFEYNGLFGCSDGIIKNVIIEKNCAAFISGEESDITVAGGIVGLNRGTVSGCQSYWSLKLTNGGELFVGGIAGKSWGREALIERCYNGGSTSVQLTESEISELCGVGGIVGITGRETLQEDYDSEDDGEFRNGVFSCNNAGKTEAVVTGSDAKLLLGGIAGANVLIYNKLRYETFRDYDIDNDRDYDSIFPDPFPEDEEKNTTEYGAAIINCASTGTCELTLRAQGARSAAGGVVGANVVALSESGAKSFFSDNKTELIAAERRKQSGSSGITIPGMRIVEIMAFAQVKNCFATGGVTGRMSLGEELFLGGIIGLCSADAIEIENCFYEQGSVGDETVGIGGRDDDETEDEDENQVKTSPFPWGGTTEKPGEESETDPEDECHEKTKAELSDLAEELNTWIEEWETEWVEEYEKPLNTWSAFKTGDYPCHSIKLIYNPMTGDDDAPIDNQIYAPGDSARVSFEKKPKKENYIFVGWADSEDATTAKYIMPDKDAKASELKIAEKKNTIVELEEDVTLYAIWENNEPTSVENTSDTKTNEDGTKTLSSTKKTVAKNGDITEETTERVTDENGKLILTRTKTSVYDHATGSTTERIREKPESGGSVYRAAFTLEDPDEVSSLPEELSKELRAGKLESMTLEDKKNGTSTLLGWEKNESGKLLAQSASISGSGNGTIKLSAALIKELSSGGYGVFDIQPLSGSSISLGADALKSASTIPTEFSVSREGNRISALTSGSSSSPSFAMELSMDGEQTDESVIMVADCVGADGEKTRVRCNLEGGILSFAVQPGQTEFEISQIAFPFIDVSKQDWFYGAVREMFGSSLMTGVSETEFAPSASTSRAMVVTLLWRMKGKPQSAAAPRFADVSSGAWYYDAVAWASENGVVNGVSQSSFAPDAPISREQLMTILFRLENYSGDIDELSELRSFSDADSVSEFAQSALRWACSEAIITGRSDGRLDPAGSASRSELAAILVRYLNK